MNVVTFAQAGGVHSLFLCVCLQRWLLEFNATQGENVLSKACLCMYIVCQHKLDREIYS